MTLTDGQSHRRKTVAMITPFFRPNIGGVEVHLDDLCKFLTEKGHNVVVLTYQPLVSGTNAPSTERKGRLEIRRVPWFGRGFFYPLERYPILQTSYTAVGLFVYSLFYLLSNSKKVDVVQTHGFIASLIGRVLKPLFPRCRFVATVHTTYVLPLGSSPWLGRAFVWILNAFDRVLTVSESCQTELEPYGLDSGKVVVFRYWADQTQFKPMDKQECKEAIGLEGGFLVLFVGRLIEIKGIHVLARTASMVSDDVQFAFITTGSRDEFVKATKLEQVPDNVRYVGAVDHSNLHLYYNAADLLAVPSQRAEGFARVNIEAMLCGTPVIASDVGYLSQVLTPEVGELLSPPSAENFAARIDFYYRNRGALKELSERCFRYALDNFTDSNASRIEGCLFN